jgi:hypothetical protein
MNEHPDPLSNRFARARGELRLRTSSEIESVLRAAPRPAPRSFGRLARYGAAAGGTALLVWFGASWIWSPPSTNPSFPTPPPAIVRSELPAPQPSAEPPQDEARTIVASADTTERATRAEAARFEVNSIPDDVTNRRELSAYLHAHDSRQGRYDSALARARTSTDRAEDLFEELRAVLPAADTSCADFLSRSILSSEREDSAKAAFREQCDSVWNALSAQLPAEQSGGQHIVMSKTTGAERIPDGDVVPLQPTIFRMFSPPRPEPGNRRADEWRPAGLAAHRLVTLPAADLQRLGIVATSRGVLCKLRKSGVTDFIRFFGRSLNYFGSDYICAFPTLPAGINPLAVTDDVGTIREIRYAPSVDDSEVVRKINALTLKDPKRDTLERGLLDHAHALVLRRIGSLLPILVRTGSAPSLDDARLRRWRPDVIVWYEPTDELLSLLEPSVREQLLAELAAARGVDAPDSVSRRVALLPCDLRFLALCGSSSGAIAASIVYPNPARGSATLRVELAAPRTLEVAIYDLGGARVRTASGSAPYAQGRHELTFDLRGLRPGIYSVGIETTAGDRAIQRLIVGEPDGD